MLERRIFSLSDLVGLLILGVIGVSIFGPVWGDMFGGRRTCCYRQSQVRGIHQGFVLYSNSNNGFYPGYTSDGTDDFAAITASVTDFGCNALTDDDIGKIYAIMLTEEIYTPEYIVSPNDNLAPASRMSGNTLIKPTIDNTNYSYALLDMNDFPSARRAEWKDVNNSQAPMVADPSSDIRPMLNVTYHSDVLWMANSDMYYEGNIAWNDNHVTFENAALFQPGKLKLGQTTNTTAVNPFKATGADDVKFIW